ncbi:PREDICTED: type II inositol 1,4,5-trisphosphate 5-phosphatase-like [Dipodomys ordii]|uniref:Type II inositol 1,4,5-trisphosphate 5-phosphatase-like n=1 Tax=Dipodomys ordii TaxID=10020 RepID=A0A1S3F6I9_DIPOR|nr:PREDICTED: type II inositol 1,4,5-trisphosphate 5-phosphatase-like [Dipodomys ordii]
MAITGDDVSLDQIIPVSRDFTLEEVSPDGELYILGSDVTVQLDTAKLSLIFQLPFGSHTRMFLQEVTRACPRFDPATPDPEFLWLSRYKCVEPAPEAPTARGWNTAPGTSPWCAAIGGGSGTRGRARLGWAEHAGGRRDEELEEAGREMSAAAGSRECDSAGTARDGKRDLGGGLGEARSWEASGRAFG